MGRNLVAPNRNENGASGAQEIQRRDAESLSMPGRGSVAQEIMSRGAPQKVTASNQTSDTSTATSQPHALYRVRPGDNPSAIAQRFKVPLQEIFAANPELEPTKMFPGQGIRIPGIQQNFHIIQKGESLGSVAATYKIALKDVVEANPQVDPRRLQIGQAVFLPLLDARDARVSATPAREERPASVAVIPQPQPASVVAKPNVSTTTERVGHSAEWRPIPVDPKLLNARFVTPLSVDPSSNFFVSVMRTLGHEGGLSTSKNDAAHQGGVAVTNYGVTGMAMTEYLKTVEGIEKKPSASALTERIKALTYGEALDIYASNYWHKDYQAIDKKVAFLLFDWGILGGARSTLMRVQEALDVDKTGKLDAATVKAMNDMDSGVLCAKITQLRIARHRERVAEVAAKIEKWDEITKSGKSPGFDRPKDQSGFLNGWIERAQSVNAYAQSKEFKDLAEVFERTAPQGADLMDPVRVGRIALKLHSNEPALIRMLQQRLTSVGFTVTEDGKFDKEMVAVVNFFQEHYTLPRQPSWGPNEMRILDALLVAKQMREQPAVAAVSPGRR